MIEKKTKDPIHVYSEIGKLKTVLVHCPGDEIKYITPSTMDELLFSSLLEPKQAIKEHNEFVQILKNEGVEVVYLIDLVLETYNSCDKTAQNEFIDRWIKECEVRETKVQGIIKKFLKSLPAKDMILKMFSGILASEIKIKTYQELVAKPMPNLYFARDPFSTIGNGVVINTMKYPIRRRETLFLWFIFNHHPIYKNAPIFSDRKSEYSIEGGDIFVYSNEVLVIGVSERTEFNAIKELAENLVKKGTTSFKKIYCIYVPHEKNLMHLDTWLTMLDYNKFLYSTNMLKKLKTWRIDLLKKGIHVKLLQKKLPQLLKEIIGQEPILIPVAGNNSQMRVDIETHFDATNFLAIRPGVVIGYDRNYDTINEMKKHGIKVLGFNGNQLSLGMGSARCMAMPLYREDIKIINKKEK